MDVGVTVVPLKHPSRPGQQGLDPTRPTERVAIIGAGAGGSSAAFWIAKAKERYGLDVEMDLYERNDYVGAVSSTVLHPYNNADLRPIELGASIFVEVNKNMWRAVDEFGLERVSYKDANTVMGIWDGSQFVLSTGGSFYSNLTSLVGALNWTSLTSCTAAEFLDAEDINPQWTRELVEAATRVNYAQNVDSIHALEGLCSLAATGASSVKGGNFQIFEQFLERSGASVHLNTTVISRAYRAVVLAAPLHQAAIYISPPGFAEIPPPQPYVRLHVTLLTTPSSSHNPARFNTNDSRVPTYIMTSYNGVRQHVSPDPDFVAMAFHGQLKNADGELYQGVHGEEHVVKIFSRQRLSDEWLEGMFGKVGWLLRKEWDAYPVLTPTTTFPSIKLARGLYYVNAFEPLISTMETETVAARNAVDLLLREELGASICPPTDHQTNASISTGKDFVLGWDC
ncbi:uncharacterized protein B0H18DRAFT_1006933 [Fomitopsis serialis]|uniref:uncharacterized protein n=1 Tax=Fomitopsis serialis TaxID=139415 RepID=UPI0020076CDC|nr:uncharacterized protein B0H18DRAFT_1006933 [Neoantrodia serialis]KAH9926192.1 hypothetical protein B0H18DRAFT_1006933 [Neoantrodia serialis]